MLFIIIDVVCFDPQKYAEQFSEITEYLTKIWEKPDKNSPCIACVNFTKPNFAIIPFVNELKAKIEALATAKKSCIKDKISFHTQAFEVGGETQPSDATATKSSYLAHAFMQVVLASIKVTGLSMPIPKDILFFTTLVNQKSLEITPADEGRFNLISVPDVGGFAKLLIKLVNDILISRKKPASHASVIAWLKGKSKTEAVVEKEKDAENGNEASSTAIRVSDSSKRSESRNRKHDEDRRTTDQTSHRSCTPGPQPHNGKVREIDTSPVKTSSSPLHKQRRKSSVSRTKQTSSNEEARLSPQPQGISK